MTKTLQSIQNRIGWLKEEEHNLTKREKEDITRKLKEVDNGLKSFILLRMAVNKQ